MIAQGLANHAQKHLNHNGVYFMDVSPGEDRTMWYGETERNIRRRFAVARKAAKEGATVIIFFDELDSMAMTRGGSTSHVDDRVLTTLMTEINGFDPLKESIFVLAATNRLDALDSAVVRPGRFGDLIIEVPRPNMEAGSEILGKYLTGAIPYATNGQGNDQAAAREEIIESVVSRIYSPNGSDDLATLVLRDSQRRAIRPVDLISGAVIANIAHMATQRACLRDIRTGRQGVCLEDLEVAVAAQFTQAASAITSANWRNHIEGLPDDAVVVRVDRPARNTARIHRYVDETAA